MNVSVLKKNDEGLDKISAQLNLAIKAHIKTANRLSFDGGLCGLGLFNYYSYQETNEDADLELFFMTIEKIIERINTNSVAYSLITIDFTELLLFLKITRRLIETRYESDAIETMLTERIAVCADLQLQNGQYDPYVGAFYPIYYSVLSGKFHHGRKGISFIEQNLTHIQTSCAFFDSKFRSGSVALGITHGVSFYVHLICIAIENGIWDSISTLRLLTRYLIGEKQDYDVYGSFFPNDSKAFKKTRLCLCYGDLGVLYALYRSACILQDNSLQDEVISMLYQTTERRSRQDTGIKDAGLLYGSAGLYLFYMNLFYITDINLFREAAEAWRSDAIHTIMKSDTTGTFLSPLSFQNGLPGALTAVKSMDRAKCKDISSLFYL